MITRNQIPAVLDHPVYDTGGHKIGHAKHVFLDGATGQPDWVSVKTGLFGTNESFVPIENATVVDGRLEVPFAKDKIKDAPNVDIDSGGRLSEQEERRLYQYYGMNWDAAWQEANQPGEGGWAAGHAGSLADTSASARDDAMTRSEERMHVGVENREAGRVRLRKYVVTEEVQQTVPVRHEEVHVEREPITDANRAGALSGPEIAEAEHEVTLHRETPVVEIKAEPVERVRLVTDERVEEETVTGQVRKERIEADLPDEDERR
ncbi:DUF2382 domain-containing protein [Streptomyces sp. NPDC001205]